LEFAFYIGAIIAFQASGPIYNAWGWPSAFFVPGVSCIVVFFLVIFLFRENPSKCSFISERELKLIRQDIDLIPKGSRKKLKDTPFRKIIFSRPVWAAALLQFQNFWNVIIVSTKVPSYMADIIHVNLTTNGQINAVVSLFNGLALALAGFASERVIRKGYLSRTNTRKAFSLISGILNGLMVFCIPYAGCNVIFLQCILFSQAICSGFAAASDVSLPAEMTKNYPAFCYSVVNTVGILGGFLAPWLSGIILDTFADKWLAWCFIYRYSGIQSFVVTLIFLLFASADRQDFDLTSEELEIRRQISENKNRKKKEPEEDDLSESSFRELAARRASVVSVGF
jgi:MFS family permease